MEDSQVLELRPTQLKTLFLVFGSALLATLGWYFFAGVPAVRWIFVAFFGLGILIFGVNLAPGSSYLRLSREGFTYCSLYKSRHYSWNEVERFGLIVVGMNRTVGFSFSSSYKGLERARKAVAAVAGYEGALPDTYGKKAAELVALLNEWKNKYEGA
jgi:hypothetical protein